MSRLVLFVCTGNICRSPMAEVLFNAKARRSGDSSQFVAQSAGTWALDDQSASANAILAMAQRGLDLSSHRGRTVSGAMLDSADVVMVMTKSHAEALGSEFPPYRRKLHLMSELQASSYDIADPIRGSIDEYESCAQELEKLIEIGYAKIKTWACENN